MNTNNTELANADSDNEVSTELVVSTLEDENDGDFSQGDLSLREAIALSNEQNGVDRITFDESLGGGTIALSQTESDPRGLGTINQDLLITDSLTIDGLGANNLTIDGVDGGGGIFRIEGDGREVTIQGLNITNGNRTQFFFQNPTQGGAISVLNSNANLTLQDSAISNSTASSAGALSSLGNVNIIGSLIVNNESGGGNFPEGAIDTRGNLSITNSTITDNTGRGIASGNSTEIINSTITDGIETFGNDLTITSSILVDDSNLELSSIGGNPIITSGGNNLIGNGDGIEGFVDSDLVGTADNPIDPRLGELQDNGGNTQTLALSEDSPAIDAGSNPNNLETDQRGAGFNRTVGSGTDIGAFEIQNDGGGQMFDELIVSTLIDENDDDFSQGDLSLREAIAIAESGATITFDGNLTGGTISLTPQELVIDKDLNVIGLGANNLTIDGSAVGGTFPDFIRSRVFNVDDGDSNSAKNVTIEGLTITGGNLDVGSGGGILNQENLTLNDVNVSDNSIVRGAGGGINNSGNLIVTNSLISNNSAQFRSSGGGISNTGTTTIANSTISGNFSFEPGGGISTSFSGNGTLDIINSTITGNSDSIANASGDGISGSATITSSIIANNGDNGDLQGNFTSGGNNLIGNGDSTSFSNGVNSDLVGTSDAPLDPRLGALQNNGGATETLALLEDSPAIDAGSNPNNLETDQRGAGFNRTVGSGTDIGAFEIQNDGGGQMFDELIVSTLVDENDDDFSQGDLSLREAIAIAEPNASITFDGNLSGGTIDLTLGELTIDQGLTINGLGANNLSISANNDSRIFLVDDGNSDVRTDVAIAGLTIANGGSFPRTDGGGFFNQENLTITDSVLTDNSGRFGLAVYNMGQLELSNSLVFDNSGAESAIYNDGGIASVSNTTIANNSTAGSNSAILNTNGGELNLSNSTIADNSSANSTVTNSDGSTATVTSTIIANNVGFRRRQGINNVSGTFISGGNNLIGDADGSIGFDEPSDITGTLENPIDPRLGELQDNGGSTATISLLTGSPAINAGSNPNGLATDQRGEGFNRTVGDATDIGALELQTIPTVTEIIGTAGGDVLFGTDGSDLIQGLDGNDTINGLADNDTIEGNSGNDSLDGFTGDDSLDGADGFDTLFGGDGNDTLLGGIGNDSLNGSIGDDFLDGGDGRDTLLGGEDNDTLIGRTGSDFLDGSNGDDSLNGDSDRDTLIGGSGNDTLDGGSGVDFLRGDDGNDTLLGAADNDTLQGSNGDDLLNGGLGIDSLDGGAGNDTLVGRDDNDTLQGGNGNDTLDGGLGSDILRGDDGDDLFVLALGSGTDTIVDFNRGNNAIALTSGIAFEDLTFSGNNIMLETETLAILNGIDTTTLVESDFV